VERWIVRVEGGREQAVDGAVHRDAIDEVRDVELCLPDKKGIAVRQLVPVVDPRDLRRAFI